MSSCLDLTVIPTSWKRSSESELQCVYRSDSSSSTTEKKRGEIRGKKQPPPPPQEAAHSFHSLLHFIKIIKGNVVRESKWPWCLSALSSQQVPSRVHTGQLTSNITVQIELHLLLSPSGFVDLFLTFWINTCVAHWRISQKLEICSL